jgi:hypothetical protein
MNMIENASGPDRGRAPFESLSRRTDLAVDYIAELAEQRRLHELADSHGDIGRPLTLAEALRRLGRIRQMPCDRLSPQARLVVLAARKAKWNDD